MQLTPTLTLLELVNALAALFGLLCSLVGWSAARDDYRALLCDAKNRTVTRTELARIAQARTNLRVQQTLALKTGMFLAISLVVGFSPGGAMFSFSVGGLVLMMLTATNILIGLTSFMIQRSRWIVLQLREVNESPQGVA